MTDSSDAEVTWLTVDEIANDLRVSRMSVYRLVSTGVLPAHRIGHNLRVTTKDFDDYLASTRIPATRATGA